MQEVKEELRVQRDKQLALQVSEARLGFCMCSCECPHYIFLPCTENGSCSSIMTVVITDCRTCLVYAGGSKQFEDEE